MYTPPLYALPPDTLLNEKYLIGRVLGEGGFGITYIARDINLGIKVTVKEYFPKTSVSRNVTVSNDVIPGEGDVKASFEKGRLAFQNEAKVLSRFHDEANIVNIRDIFSQNNTSYFVTSFVSGVNLSQYISSHGKLSFKQMFDFLAPIMKASGRVHSQGLIHRDISPNNIIIADDGTTTLIDFGTARDYFENPEMTYSVVLKVGYSPEEQYRRTGKQGPWTDIYALSATAYFLLTGKTPIDSLSRLFDDTLESITAQNSEVTPQQEAAVRKGMAVRQSDRYNTMEEMYAAFESCLAEASQSVTAAPVLPVTESAQTVPLKKPDESVQPSAPVQQIKSAVEKQTDKAADAVQTDSDQLKKKPRILGLIGSLVLGASTLFSFPLFVSIVENREREEFSFITILVCFAIVCLLGFATFAAGKTYYPRVMDKPKRANVLFLILGVVSIAVAAAFVAYLSYNYNNENQYTALAAAFDMAVTGVFFSWLFYRRLTSAGKSRFRTGASAVAVLSVLFMAGFLAFRSLSTVSFGDGHYEVKEESISVFGDLLTNRDMERLKRFRNLKRLTITACFLDDEDVRIISELKTVEYISLGSNTDITDISPLASMPQLKELSLYDTSVEDISSLAELEELQSLDISKTNIKDLSCLSSFKSLESLSMSNLKELDPGTVAAPPQLAELEAENTGLTSIEFLKPAAATLRRLEAGANHISDLTPLIGFVNLSHVDIQMNEVSDISPLESAPLYELRISDNNISDISVLKDKDELRYLYASFNSISDISALADKNKLYWLEISNNSISDISPLKDCFNIIGLDLSCNRISDISPLATIDNLIDADLKHNEISDISPLKSCANLFGDKGVIESLAYNRITDISPLSGYKGTAINLAHNNISDISVFESIPNAKHIDLRNNEISDVSGLLRCTNAKTVKLEHNKLTDISSLISLPSLHDIYAADNNISDIGKLINELKVNEEYRYLSLTYRDTFDMDGLNACQNFSADIYDADARTQSKFPAFKFHYRDSETLANEEQAEYDNDMTYKPYLITIDEENGTDADAAAETDTLPDTA